MVGAPLEPEPEGEGSDELTEGPRYRAWLALRHNVSFWVGVLLVLGVVFAAVFAPVLAPHDPDHQFFNGLSPLGAPLEHTARFPLGTDSQGRDLLSRLLYGARLSLGISFLGNGLAILVGVSLGSAAAWWRGLLEQIIMRLTDIMLAFPALLLALAIVAVRGPSLTVIIVVIGMVSWTGICRITYGQVLSFREREWVDAARAVGAGSARILIKHLLPHLMPAIIVYGTLGIGLTVVFEGSLSYLGLGVPDPSASWGRMINLGANSPFQFYWQILYPSLALFITVFGFNMLGDALRDALDPHGPPGARAGRLRGDASSHT